MRILLLTLLVSFGASASCIEEYRHSIEQLIIEESEDGNAFSQSYLTLMAMPLAYGIGGATAGPALALTVGGSGTVAASEASERTGRIDSQSKSYALLLNAEAGEGSQLDTTIGELMNSGVNVERDAVIERLRLFNTERVYCSTSKLATYTEIKNSLK